MTAWTQAIGCLMLASTLTACQTTPRLTEPSLTNQTWRLKQVDQYHFEYDRYNMLPQLWFVANDNVFSGRDGCTWLGGEYHLNQRKLNIRLNSDEQHCRHPYSQLFLQHLQSSKKYYIKNQKLHLVGKDRKVHLVFEAREGQPQAPLQSLTQEQKDAATPNGLFYVMR